MKDGKTELMKLLIGNVLIETDNIEAVEKLTTHTVRLYFVSGYTLEVVCGLKSTHRAVWDQDADGLIQTLQNTDSYQKKENRD